MLRAAGVLLLALLTLGGEWKVAVPDYAWDFPQDHWRHPGYRTEWLYFTGHLEATDGRRFGYQFTFFRIGVLPEPVESASSWSTRARSTDCGHPKVRARTRPRDRLSARSASPNGGVHPRAGSLPGRA